MNNAVMLRNVRAALSTAYDYLMCADDYDYRTFGDRWRAHCLREAKRKKDDARFYLRQIRDQRAWKWEQQQ